MRLYWTVGSSDSSELVIERSVDKRHYVAIGIVSANITTFTDTGLQTNQLYMYRVYTTNGNSECSAWNYGATLASVTSTNGR